MAINAILASLVDVIKADLERFSPRFRWIVNHVSGEDAILEFSINKARDAAWSFANKLAERPVDKHDEAIRLRDAEVTLIAQLIRRPGLIGSIFVWWVRLKESKNVPWIIKELRNSYKESVDVKTFARS